MGSSGPYVSWPMARARSASLRLVELVHLAEEQAEVVEAAREIVGVARLVDGDGVLEHAARAVEVVELAEDGPQVVGVARHGGRVLGAERLVDAERALGEPPRLVERVALLEDAGEVDGVGGDDGAPGAEVLLVDLEGAARVAERAVEIAAAHQHRAEPGEGHGHVRVIGAVDGLGRLQRLGQHLLRGGREAEEVLVVGGVPEEALRGLARRHREGPRVRQRRAGVGEPAATGGALGRIVGIVGEDVGDERDRELGPPAPLALREPVAHRRLHQAVHREGVVVGVDQRRAAERLDGVVEGERVAQRRRQRRREEGSAAAQRVPRDVVRGEERAQGQELAGRGRARLRIAEGDVPGGRHGGGAVALGAPLHQLRAPLAEPGQVLADAGARLIDVGGRLRQRQRQIAERLGELARVRLLVLPGAAAVEEQLHRLAAAHGAQRQRQRHAAPGRVARGDEDVAHGVAGEVALHVLRIAGAVEDDEPALVVREPVPHRLHGGVLVGLDAARKPQRHGEVGDVGRERGRLLGAQPPHVVVVGRVAIGVLQRQRRLADAAEAVDRLHRGVRHAPRELLAQAIDLVDAAGEGEVAPERHVPHGRKALRLGLAHPRGAWSG